MAKKQFWKVKIYTWLSSLLDKLNPTRYYKPAMVTPNVIVSDKFLENVARETGLSEFQARAVLSSIRRTAGDYLEAGNAVQLDEDFGTLKPFIKVKGTDQKEKCNSECILGVGVKFIPTGKMKKILEEVTFQFVGTTSDKDGIDDPEEVTPQPTPTPTQTLYTLTFQHNGSTTKTEQLAEGAAITAPTAPSGYHWKDVPATMPANNVTITSEEDSVEPPSLT